MGQVSSTQLNMLEVLRAISASTLSAIVTAYGDNGEGRHSTSRSVFPADGVERSSSPLPLALPVSIMEVTVDAGVKRGVPDPVVEPVDDAFVDWCCFICATRLMTVCFCVMGTTNIMKAALWILNNSYATSNPFH